MKKIIDTIKNIFKIEELRTRLTYTFVLILVYRLGCQVVLPGIDGAALVAHEGSSQGLLGLLDMFSGGAFSSASIFALGVMPYISASIVVQLLGIFVPYFRKLQMEGESGRRKLNQLTRYLTIAILLIQVPAYLLSLGSQGVEASERIYFHKDWPTGFFGALLSYRALILISGSMFVMWLGERITDRGIGNGISLIIMIGIVARFPLAITTEIGKRLALAGGGFLFIIIEFVVWFFVLAAAIALVQAVRKVPVQYAKRMIGNRQYGGTNFLPLKINAAGVMPIIFAQALMMLPMLFAGYSSTMASMFNDYTGFWYNLVFGILVVLFTYFYTAITVNPQMISEELKKNGGFIPGVKPGKKTMEYLDEIMSRVTLPGSIFLAFIAIMPAFARMAGIDAQFASFFGGTSLLITVGVVLDTLQQIEGYLLMRHYDGLMKTGRLSGRSGM